MSSVSQVVVTIFLVLGALLMAVAAVGIVRMPDLYLRMSAATKASTMGSALLLLGAGIHFGDLAVFTQVVATIFFLLATAPVGAHIIGRAAYRKGKASLLESTKPDRLKEYYDGVTDDG